MLGVDFFFMLSGFVLGHVYLVQVDAGRFNFWNFIVRRFARIWPLHLLVLIATIALGIVGHRLGWTYSVWALDGFLAMERGEMIRALFANLVMIHAWGATGDLTFNLPSWSISAEWFAYLFFPLFVLLLRRLRPGLAVLAAAALLVVMDLGSRRAMGFSVLEVTWNIGVLRIIPEFALGLALRRWGAEWSLGSAARARAVFFGSLAAVVAVTFLKVPSCVPVLLLAVLLFSAADLERHGGLQPICRPFPVLLGDISYAVYMLHFPVGCVMLDALTGPHTTTNAWAALGWIGAALALVTLLSWLSQKLYEKPTRQWLIAAGKL
jgi:peptidoglycan/LPS O-acetylase OafA/YrhL